MSLAYEETDRYLSLAYSLRYRMSDASRIFFSSSAIFLSWLSYPSLLSLLKFLLLLLLS